MNGLPTVWRRCSWAVLGSVMYLLLAWFGPQPLLAGVLDRAVFTPNRQTEALCRLGVNATHGYSDPFEVVDLAPLRMGWYIDYLARPTPPRPGNIEYTPVIRLTQVGATGYTSSPRGASLQAAISGNPGADWVIGNEPDRRHVQDDLLPAVYALAYHDLYHMIKQADPTAKIFAGAIVQPTPLRLQYLDRVLQSYYDQFGTAMPVDGWAIHNFILNEASCDHYQDLTICWGAEIPPGFDEIDGLRIDVQQNDDVGLFIEQVQRFRLWMATRGYWGKPLYVTEYGVLMPDWLGFPPQRVNQFMTATFDYMLNTTDFLLGDPTDGYRLVQRMGWFSTVTTDFNGYLYQRNQPSDPYQLSPMGQHWVEYVSGLTAETDLYPVRVSFDPPLPPLTSAGAVTVTVKALITNSGNRLAAQPFAVRFYDGDPSQGALPIGPAQTVALSGCGDQVEVAVVWPNVAPGQHQVFVAVDPSNTVTESDETNNIRIGGLFFATSQLHLPLIRRSLFTQ
jgi:hypothetical protein